MFKIRQDFFRCSIVLGLFISFVSTNKDIERYSSFFYNAKTILGKSLSVYNINKDKEKLNKIIENLEKKKLLSQEFVKGSGHANLYGNALLVWENYKLLGGGYKNFYASCQKKKYL